MRGQEADIIEMREENTDKSEDGNGCASDTKSGDTEEDVEIQGIEDGEFWHEDCQKEPKDPVRGNDAFLCKPCNPVEDDDEIVDDDLEDEAEVERIARDPAQPTKKQREEHNAAHSPHRP